MKKTFSSPIEMNYMKYKEANGRFELGSRSHRKGGASSRASSQANVPYVAFLGITARVTKADARAAALSDAFAESFSELSEQEQPELLQRPANRPLMASVLTAVLSSLVCGLTHGAINTPSASVRVSLGVPSAVLTPDNEEVPMPYNDALWGFVVAIYSLGALVGCNCGTTLADRWGRRTYLLWNTMILVIGVLMQAAACLPECDEKGGWEVCLTRVGLLMAGRAVVGIGSGGATVVLPIYLGEISPAHLRGSIGALNQLMLALGMLCTQLLGLPSMLGSITGWPYVLAAPLLPACLQLLMQPALVESPRWHAVYGNELMAEQTLLLLHDRPPDTAELHEELFRMLEQSPPPPGVPPPALELLSQIGSCSSSSVLKKQPREHGAQPTANGRDPQQSHFMSERANGVSAGCSHSPAAARSCHSALHAAVTKPSVRRAISITIALVLLQQASGISNAFNFSFAFLQQSGVSADECATMVIAMNLSHVFATILSATLMHKAGRRPLLMGSVFLSGAFVALLSFALRHAAEAWAPPLCGLALVGFVGSYSLGLGPVALLLPAEIFPAAQRTSGSVLASSVMWLANFAVSMTFVAQSASLRSFALAPHAAVLGLGLVFCACSVPETRGKSLEQIEREMMDT